MAAYLIFTREGPVRDEAEMAQYAAKNAAAGPTYAASYGIRPLAFYGALEAIEGDAPDGVVLLEFPDAAKARAWYDSPEYQDALQHRLKAATYRCTLVEGV
jgi:uncharacterized protein (DUF1330 family)